MGVIKRKSRLVLTSWLVALATSLIPQPAGAAVSFNYNTKVTYRVEGKHTQVSEIYTITNNTARQYLSEIKLSSPVPNLTNLSAKYEDGATIPATVAKKRTTGKDPDYDYHEINIKFPRQVFGAGKTWTFNLSYQATGLVDSKGSAHTVYLPSIEPGDSGDKYTAAVDVPANFGTPHFAGAKAAAGGKSGDRQIYTFSKEELVDHSLALAFGNATVYSFNFNFPLFNDSLLPRTLTVTLPPDLNNQQIFVESLDPAPQNTRLDRDGNILADYRLRPGQRLTVRTKVSGEVKYLEYDLDQSGRKSDIPPDLVQKYTRPTRYWPTDGPIVAASAPLVKDSEPVIDNIQAIYQFVIDKLSYNKEKIKFNIRQGAHRALANPENAVCLEYSDLMIAMLRSQGIPARMPVGYSYSGNLKDSNSVIDSLHSWVEAYVPGIGWMSLDPTWGEKFDQFGQSDLDHLAFAVWGEEDQLPGSVMAGSRDTGYQYEAAELQFLEKVTPFEGKSEVVIRRFALLPFISFDRAIIKTGSQTASDGNLLRLDGRKVDLGSLAPVQQLAINQFNLGWSWLRRADVAFGRQQSDKVLVLAVAQTNPNYVPLAIVGSLTLIAGGWVAMIRLRGRKTRSGQGDNRSGKSRDDIEIVSEDYG